ncbi:MAG: hypothetical protein R3332_08180 [Pseudohongiellaceae bacterium]|nr:hypothetical protein [Pseudohongiellaceae bacterium]
MLALSSLSQSRFSAAFAHFLFSVAVFTLFVGVLIFFWFPNPYFSASGGWQGLRIVAAVDLVLGPLITLIIFNSKKSRRELSFDIGVVVLIQLSALLWGIKSVYEQRPVAVAFMDSSFYTVPASALSQQGFNLAELDEFGEDRPVFVYIERPYEGADLERFVEMVEEEGVPPHEQPWLYRPMADNFDRIRNANLDIDEIVSVNAAMKADLEDLLEASGTSLHDNFYIALTSRYRNVVLVFDPQARLLGYVNAPYKKGEV